MPLWALLPRDSQAHTVSLECSSLYTDNGCAPNPWEKTVSLDLDTRYCGVLDENQFHEVTVDLCYGNLLSLISFDYFYP